MSTQDEQEHNPPALFLHICTVYEAMRKEAKQVDGKLLYKGFTVKLITKQVGLPVPYYTHVTQALKAMGCALQERRGGSTSPSEWVLLREPDLDAFEAWQSRRDRSPASKSKTAQTQGQIRDLASRMNTVEDGYDTLIDVVAELAEENKELKETVDQLRMHVLPQIRSYDLNEPKV